MSLYRVVSDVLPHRDPLADRAAKLLSGVIYFTSEALL